MTDTRTDTDYRTEYAAGINNTAISDDGRYKRKRNAETGKIIPEYNWVWSPQGIINMHYPEYWGKLLFSSEKAGKAK